MIGLLKILRRNSFILVSEMGLIAVKDIQILREETRRGKNREKKQRVNLVAKIKINRGRRQKFAGYSFQ
jgi:hypothetical protein